MIQGKLGTCSFCINATIIIASIGWVFYAIFFFIFPNKMLFQIFLTLGAFFTLHLGAHGIAYLVKRKKINV